MKHSMGNAVAMLLRRCQEAAFGDSSYGVVLVAQPGVLLVAESSAAKEGDCSGASDI